MGWSSVRTFETDESVRVVVSTPGVATADLKVSVVDDSILEIQGQTVKGPHVFGLRRRVLLPRAIDVSSAAVTHKDGELVISLNRVKPVVINVPITAVAAPSAAKVEEADPLPQPSMQSNTEDDAEWVEAENVEI